MGTNGSKKSTDYDSNDENLDLYDDGYVGNWINHKILRGPPFDVLVNICPEPPFIKDMKDFHIRNCIFMIQPFKYNPLKPNCEPVPINNQHRYVDKWDEHHVRMPCSPSNINRNGQSRWSHICRSLLQLKQKCDRHMATFEDLKRTIENSLHRHYNMDCLEHLINEIYDNDQRSHFMSNVLSNICTLALNVDIICSQPPPLLRAQSNDSVTMSQRQVASLLACAFFCLFPFRSDSKIRKEYQNFPNPNFNMLYQRGYIHKIEKLKCILHYFRRITENMPNGVITIRRYALPKQLTPTWSESRKGLSPMHLTTGKRIENIDNSLQVDFANRYIGGGVLSAGCVQEEIRFTICPEMLVSLLVCEAMQSNECIFLIGCERYSSYKGYSKTFKFAGNYNDTKPKDNWGRKWCHLVAIDAIFFRNRSEQYHMKYVTRELLKAYTGFYTRGQTVNQAFPIATGNWGCGAFNGDKQLKALIQLIAASESVRPLIYATYGDRKLVESFSAVYDYLISERATVRDLYRYLSRYCHERPRLTLFDFIIRTPLRNL